MSFLGIEQNGEVTLLAAEAQAAVGAGDTGRARTLFREAGRKLEASVNTRRRRWEKDLLRFLAASQYYKGGLYRDALRLCSKIDAKFLPDRVRELYPPFLQDVRGRADPSYGIGMQALLLKSFKDKRYPQVLELLAEHPYVLPPWGMAFLRALCSEELKDFRAAALFYADALKLKPQVPDLIRQSAALPLALLRENRLTEAEDYIKQQLELLPHPLTYVNASLLRFHQALQASSDEDRRILFTEQVRLMETAWERYQAFPPNQASHSGLRDFMTLGLGAAGFTLLRLGWNEQVTEVCARLLGFVPSSPQAKAARDYLLAALEAPNTETRTRAQAEGERFVTRDEDRIAQSRERDRYLMQELMSMAS